MLWSTGFIATRLGVLDCPPITLLALRFLAATLLVGTLALCLSPAWPRKPRVVGHLVVAGLLNHALYLGLSFEANAGGMPVSSLALIGALQPVLTALGAAWLLAERVGRWQWLGLVLGFTGVTLVLFDRVAVVPAANLVWLAFGGLAAFTAGTLYQKRFCGDTDLLAGTAVQFVAVTLSFWVAAALLEPFRVDWTPRFAGALAWLVVVNSTITVNLLYWLIRRGEAARVTSLFYLVPPVTGLMAWVALGERFGEHFYAGATIALAGVLLALRAPRVLPAAGGA